MKAATSFIVGKY